VACVGVAVTDQQHAPQPPLTAVESLLPSATNAAPDSVLPGAAKSAASTTDPALTASRLVARRTAAPAKGSPPTAPGSRVIPPPPKPAPVVIGPVLRGSAPVALSIPAIGVRSPLLHLGLTSRGALEVPPPGRHYNEAGWYRYSPTPGSIGPAVIVGHVDSASGGPSVFFRLGGLHAGDSVRITRADGSVAVFAVDEVRRYHKAQFPTKLVYGNTNRAALRLISCGGPFNRATGHYVDNIVVMASLVRIVG
jgi:hypothetical protein